jgi:hypothetical protein
MEYPYERLLDACERGWKSSPGSRLGRGNQLTPEQEGRIKGKYMGFVLTADAQSTGRSTIGHIQSELWYFPVSGASDVIMNPDTQRGRTRADTDRNRNQGGVFGVGVKRLVTQPKIEQGVVQSLGAASRRIAFAQLRNAYANPVSTPMRD